jgi:DNA-binding NarL/FixJ family response regulator
MVVENQSVFGAGVQRLLAGAAGLEVIEFSPGDYAELIQEIRRVQPDVIVLDEVTHLADPIRLLSFLQGHPELRLMVVSPNDNLVRVYDKYQVLVTQAADLISIVCASNVLCGKEGG